VNLLLGGFNLLPAFPMDGGRVFRALLSLQLGPVRATRIAAFVAQGLALLIALVGIRYNLFLVLIAMFIWMGAVTEASLVSARSVLAGTTARSAMETNFQVLQPDDSLGQAVALTLDGSQKDFPVVRDGDVVGVLPGHGPAAAADGHRRLAGARTRGHGRGQRIHAGGAGARPTGRHHRPRKPHGTAAHPAGPAGARGSDVVTLPPIGEEGARRLDANSRSAVTAILSRHESGASDPGHSASTREADERECWGSGCTG
jgi:hypothetical protein